MAEYWVYLDIFKVPKELLKHCTSYAGIDRGCSLTKVVIVPKNTVSEDATCFELHCSSFLNNNFEKALEYIKNEAYFATEEQEIHVTGAGCDMFKENMEKILGRKTSFVDEFFSQLRGGDFLLKNLSEDQLFHPWVTLQDYLNYERLNDISAFQSKHDITGGELTSEIKKVPYVFVFLGSAAGIVPVTEAGPGKPAFASLGGRCFLGLARLVLGTGDYLEITELASRGKGTSDTYLHDFFPTDVNVHGEEPKSQFLHPFGKLEDVEDYEMNKEDVALSLVRAFSTSLAEAITFTCRANHIRRVVIGGNMARAEIFRVSFLQAFTNKQALDTLEVRFLKTGHTGAIGTMITDPKEVTMSFFGAIKPKQND